MTLRLHRFVLSCVVSLSCTPLAVAPRDAGEVIVDDEDAGVDAGPTALEARQYCERIGPFFCEFYLRCGRMAVSTQAECLAVLKESCEARYQPRYVLLEDAGMVTLSAEGIEACRAHLSTVSCDQQPFDLLGPCSTMWRGAAPEGAGCGLDIEGFVCAPGTHCRLSVTFCGTCETHAPLGGSCADGGRCAPEAQCLNGICEARALPGQPCDVQNRCITGVTCVDGGCVGRAWVGEGEACDQSRVCGYHANCIGGRCRKGALLGQPCGPQTGCSSGVCQGGLCAALSPLGASCSTSAACSSGNCAAGACARLEACFTP